MIGVRTIFLMAFCLLAACGKREAEAPSPPLALSHTQAEDAASVEIAANFDGLVEALTEDYFSLLPETATYYGAPDDLAPGADSRLDERSPAAAHERVEKMEAMLAHLKAIDETRLDPARRLTRDTLVIQLDGALGPARLVDYGLAFSVYGSWFTPYVVMQNAGPTVDTLALLQAQQPVTNAADAEAFLARLAGYDAMIAGVIDKLRHDDALGAAAPDFVLAKARAVLKAFAAPRAKDNALVTGFAEKLKKASLDGEASLLARAEKLVAQNVYSANKRLDAYLAEQQKSAPHDAGIWRLPEGAALYQALIRQMTDTDLSAEEIFEIGEREVARITDEMDEILKAQGYGEGSVAERMAGLAKEERFYYPDTPEGKAAILDEVEGEIERANAALPRWFARVPGHPVEVRAVPAFSEASAPGGYYDSPAVDGSRPGVYWINLRDTAIWPKFALPTLTYHEAVPGHHLQTALALDKETPLIVTVLYSNAYGEGWALYAEALAKEMGLYADDPFGDLGRLQDELHRAIRLVVDTGMHWKRWSREEAIDYMVMTEGADPSEAESEIERYAVWPAQALGYKIGMLKIEALRKSAQDALQGDFDIRDFHDEILKDGAVPLPVLDAKIDAYIAARRR
ncbi:MAG: DUF885 family protein [Amphiplicatus sp.]